MVYSSSKDEGTIDREIFLKDDRDGIVALEDLRFVRTREDYINDFFDRRLE